MILPCPVGVQLWRDSDDVVVVWPGRFAAMPAPMRPSPVIPTRIALLLLGALTASPQTAVVSALTALLRLSVKGRELRSVFGDEDG
jgi:hypothetical protein